MAYAARPDSYRGMGGRVVLVEALPARAGLPVYDGVPSYAVKCPAAHVAVAPTVSDTDATPRYQPVAAVAVVGGAVCVKGCGAEEQTYFVDTALRSFAWYLAAVTSSDNPPFVSGRIDWLVKKALFGIEVPIASGTFAFAAPTAAQLGLILSGAGDPLGDEVQLWARAWPGQAAPTASGVTLTAAAVLDRLGGGGRLVWDPNISTGVVRLTGDLL